MAEKRFVKTYKQGGFVETGMEIWVDTQTGVNYLCAQAGYGCGLTVLLDREGKPIVTPPSQLREE